MPKFAGSLTKYPARVSLASFVVLVALGTLALWSPISGTGVVRPISLLDALFTATSAACVTGLSVRSTPEDFTFVGQLFIVLLIQIGGVGIMTITTYLMFQLGSRSSLRQSAVFSEAYGGSKQKDDLKWLLGRVLLWTVVFEGAGMLILAVRFLFEHRWYVALWHAVFHSVSAFCNAGFALHDSNLERYQGDIVVNGVIMTLIVLGGIGYPVLLDLERHWRRGKSWREYWDAMHLHTKLTLITTAALLSAGTLTFLVLEWENSLKNLPIWQRVMAAAFQSVTCRTAGFNTTPQAALTNASLFISILLMAIGAAPGSTAGGFKVSTLATLVCHSWAAFRGQTKVNVFRRTIPSTTIQRAVATVMLFAVVAIIALTALLLAEHAAVPHSRSGNQFLDSMFEVISALGTVGLSTGITPKLTPVGKIIIIILMFAGRLGPISVFAALSLSEKKTLLTYPEEEPMIG
jgi:trk system potassium uptake protein TrkH